MVGSIARVDGLFQGDNLRNCDFSRVIKLSTLHLVKENINATRRTATFDGHRRNLAMFHATPISIKSFFFI